MATSSAESMCNHYQNHPEAIPTWREYVGAAGDIPFSEIKIDVWPKYQAMVVRLGGGQTMFDTMQWGVPLTMKGKRPGTTITKQITNVRNPIQPLLAINAHKD